jgi:hypothetical protein
MTPLTEIRFLGPSGNTGHSAIYLATNEADDTLASVNAGNEGLWVGGGGINAQFHRENPQGDYAAIHERVLRKAHLDLSAWEDDPDDPVAFIYVSRPAKPLYGIDGTVFIDGFIPARAPHGNPANYAMIYVVPPAGFNYSDRDFLDAIQATAENIASSVASFNHEIAPGHQLQIIETLRMCAYSSSIFLKPTVSVDAVVNRIYDGLNNRGFGSVKTLEFENGDRNFQAVKTRLGSAK